MDHDDDVEHLFSWLQTPELRYREFAGAREITDSVMIVQQQRANNTPVPEDEPVGAPHHNTQLNEEYPEDQFPDQGETRVEMLVETPPAAPANVRPAPPEHVRPVPVVREDVRIDVREETKMTVHEDSERVVVREEEKVEVREEVRGAGRGPLIIPPVAQNQEPSQPTGERGVFSLDAAGRSSMRQGPAEWAGPRPPLIQTPPAPPAPSPASAQPPAPPPRPSAPPAAPPVAASAGGGLLGGAYRESGTNGHSGASAAPADQPPAPGPDNQQTSERSLDAVFGRLSGGRSRLPDPRERLRHIPGLGPPAGRPR